MVTLGERGSLYLSATESVLVDAVVTRAIDTSGAGDCYLGSLAYYLAKSETMESSMKRAAAIASISVTRHGTQTSYPRKHEIPVL